MRRHALPLLLLLALVTSCVVGPDYRRPQIAAPDVLRGQTDAKGRRLEVVEIPAPTVLKDEDGEWVDYSYINHYLCNGGVVLCAFDDPNDELAAGIFRRLFPGRTVTPVARKGSK